MQHLNVGWSERHLIESSKADEGNPYCKCMLTSPLKTSWGGRGFACGKSAFQQLITFIPRTVLTVHFELFLFPLTLIKLLTLGLHESTNTVLIHVHIHNQLQTLYTQIFYHIMYWQIRINAIALKSLRKKPICLYIIIC